MQTMITKIGVVCLCRITIEIIGKDRLKPACLRKPKSKPSCACEQINDFVFLQAVLRLTGTTNSIAVRKCMRIAYLRRERLSKNGIGLVWILPKEFSGHLLGLLFVIRV